MDSPIYESIENIRRLIGEVGNNLFNALQQDDVDLIFYNGYNNDTLLNQFITSMINDEIYILPFDNHVVIK